MLGLVETQSKKQPLPGEAIRYSFIDFKVQKVASDQSHFLVTGREFSEFELCVWGGIFIWETGHISKRKKGRTLSVAFLFFHYYYYCCFSG